MFNLEEMISLNEYFDGHVKSLGYTSAEGKSTIGIMENGEYEFGTTQHETVTVIEGSLKIQLPGETIWKTINAGESFEVEADRTFRVQVNFQTSYLCKYR